SILSPKPEGRSTPSGAMTRKRRLFPSAVLRTITIRLMFGLSSAATLCKRAHCSLAAPGGVSQRSCQSPCLDFTTPWQTAPGPLANSQIPMSVSPKRRRAPVVLIDSIARATEGPCLFETFEPLPARFMLEYSPDSSGMTGGACLSLMRAVTIVNRPAAFVRWRLQLCSVRPETDLLPGMRRLAPWRHCEAGTPCPGPCG